jgi:hypothetical protein
MVQPVTCAILLVAGCAATPGPRLLAASPAQGSPGALIALTGTDLCAGDCATAAGEVLLGLGAQPLRAPVASYDDTMAVIAVPSLAPVGATQIVVTVGSASSNALAFEVLP